MYIKHTNVFACLLSFSMNKSKSFCCGVLQIFLKYFRLILFGLSLYNLGRVIGQENSNMIKFVIEGHIEFKSMFKKNQSLNIALKKSV